MIHFLRKSFFISFLYFVLNTAFLLSPLLRSSFLYSFAFFFGTFTTASEEVFAKAFLPIVLAFNFSVSMTISFKFLHPSNARFPMETISFPIVIFFNFLFLRKALSAMDVT